MDTSRIIVEMHKLEKKLKYKFNNIYYLSKAMCAIKLGKKSRNNSYQNDGLAVVGDALIKFVLSDKIYRVDNIDNKGKITTIKKNLESNSTFNEVIKKEKWIDHAYNELHFSCEPNIPVHEQVVNKKHSPYLEAIAGAIYYDSDFETVKKWILEQLLPLLEKYSGK